jgi:hypothetical protein
METLLQQLCSARFPQWFGLKLRQIIQLVIQSVISQTLFTAVSLDYINSLQFAQLAEINGLLVIDFLTIIQFKVGELAALPPDAYYFKVFHYGHLQG